MKFFDYLNFRHPNIKFIFEKQNGSKLAFLDILISNENDNEKKKNFMAPFYGWGSTA